MTKKKIKIKRIYFEVEFKSGFTKQIGIAKYFAASDAEMKPKLKELFLNPEFINLIKRIPQYE